jgi:tetratricopeptide (TPR) repeat protein
MSVIQQPENKAPKRIKYVPVVGPRLKLLLTIIFALFAVLCVNSVYLVSVTLLDWSSGAVLTGLTYKNYFHVWMFGLHVALGLLILVPVVLFGVFHIRNARNRPNRRAVRAGYALFTVSLILLFTGIVLTRVDLGAFRLDIKAPAVRNTLYWVHVLSPLVVAWLFILHRLAGRRIKWKVGLTWAAVAGVFALVMTVLHSHDPKTWNQVGPKAGQEYFFPSLVRTSTGNFVDADTLMMNEYCLKCHADIYENWYHSVHRFSSFTNPAYLFSVRETRRVSKERDGNVNASRWCAGCHDPVPFLSGAFEDPRFDDPDYDLSQDPMASAGITCTVCHAVTHLNSTKGNADFTIEEPTHYPFAKSTNPILQWINNQLVKAQPELHKRTFLKPLHKTAEFCSTCHKVHLPPELNDYKWLRGQNHYDPYLLSGVSGHGVQSWYYPPKATHTCAECHMPLMASNDFGAKYFEKDESKDFYNTLAVHDHMFPSANTAIPHLEGMPEWVNAKHDKFMNGFIRVDLFAIKDGGTIDSPLIAPLRPEVPALVPGRSYMLDAVIRTLKVGHIFSQGTADSNEIWLDVKITSGDRVIARSGGINSSDGEVDPWSHFVNMYMLDRDGKRIDRRNPQNIFTPLYNNQIPPGAADTVHYVFTVPPDASEPIKAEVKLNYRKFDTAYMKHFQGDEFVCNDLPISVLAKDSVTFPLATGSAANVAVLNEESTIDAWQRWNDYGIGLFRKGEGAATMSKGELKQAEFAFAQVEKLGRPDGPLNRARVYVKEGRLEDAVQALKLAADHTPPAPPWSVAWFTGLVNKQNGNLDEAIANFRSVLAMKDTEECRKREFDFTLDYNLLAELGQTLFERAKQERGPGRAKEREALLREAIEYFDQVLALDAENLTAHYNMQLIYAQLGDEAKAEEHHQLHLKYKPDDNARDHAIAVARMNNPAANHAAEAIVIYDLQRPGAHELPSTTVASLPSHAGEAEAHD